MPIILPGANSSTPAAIGKGYAFSIGATTLGGVLDLKPGKIKQERMVVQANDSATLFGDKVLGWMDCDDWDLKLIYTGAERFALVGQMNQWLACIFTRPDGSTTQPFTGAIIEVGDEVPLKEFQTISIKIATTGAVS